MEEEGSRADGNGRDGKQSSISNKRHLLWEQCFSWSSERFGFGQYLLQY